MIDPLLHDPEVLHKGTPTFVPNVAGCVLIPVWVRGDWAQVVSW